MSQPPPSSDPANQQPGQPASGYGAQAGYPQQPPPPQGQPGYPPPGYPPQYPPQAGYPYQPQPGQPYPPQMQYPQAPYGPVNNPRANSALIYGVISVVLGGITVVTQVGFAGVITGSFALFYGIGSLNFANKYPHKPGRGQAIAAIVLGSIGLLLVLIGIGLQFSRSANGGSSF